LRWQRARESGERDDKNDKTKSHSRFLRDRTRLRSLFCARIFYRRLLLFCFSWSVKVGLALICLFVLSASAQNVDPALCGPYPKNYKEIVWNWMQGVLL